MTGHPQINRLCAQFCLKSCLGCGSVIRDDDCHIVTALYHSGAVQLLHFIGTVGFILCLAGIQMGLDAIDRRMLTTIIRNYGGGPVGLEPLAAAIGEESVTLEDVYEPYLMQIGFLSRTPRGRCATPLAYEHLGLTPNGRPQPAPEADQLSLLEDE